jgi:hypothetical protein
MENNDQEAGVVDIQSIDTPELLENIDASDLVFGRDRNFPTHKTLFWGRERLDYNAHWGKGERLAVLNVIIDFSEDTLELEKLAAAVLVCKGSCDYRPSDFGSDAA